MRRFRESAFLQFAGGLHLAELAQVAGWRTTPRCYNSSGPSPGLRTRSGGPVRAADVIDTSACMYDYYPNVRSYSASVKADKSNMYTSYNSYYNGAYHHAW